MEVIWEKEPESAARFGILSNCSHVFCLSCIRRWRAAEQFDKKTIRHANIESKRFLLSFRLGVLYLSTILLFL